MKGSIEPIYGQKVLKISPTKESMTIVSIGDCFIPISKTRHTELSLLRKTAHEEKDKEN